MPVIRNDHINREGNYQHRPKPRSFDDLQHSPTEAGMGRRKQAANEGELAGLEAAEKSRLQIRDIMSGTRKLRQRLRRCP